MITSMISLRYVCRPISESVERIASMTVKWIRVRGGADEDLYHEIKENENVDSFFLVREKSSGLTKTGNVYLKIKTG